MDFVYDRIADIEILKLNEAEELAQWSGKLSKKAVTRDDLRAAAQRFTQAEIQPW